MRMVEYRNQQIQNQTHHRGHAHFWQRARLSRRGFLWTVTAAGLVAAKSDGAAPQPIPGGFQVTPGGPFFHVSGGPGAENSSITDFNGFMGSAFINGTGTGTDLNTGAQSRLNFDSDMRFMRGEYIGVDGKHYQGTFAFVWLDLYQGVPDFVNFSNQIHDFDPGIAPNGVFWTVPVAPNTVYVHSGEGEADVDVKNLALYDFFSIPNFLTGGSSAPAVVSYHLRWSGVTKRIKTRDVVNGFAGEFVENNATVEWSAQTDHFQFVSDPENTSTSYFSELGHERNGVFFPQSG